MMEYFYRAQTEQFESVDIPKELLTGKKFSSLSLAAKMLYAVLLTKMGDAAKNSCHVASGNTFYGRYVGGAVFFGVFSGSSKGSDISVIMPWT